MLKKQTFNANEIALFEEAIVYKRGKYWQMRMWLAKEKKYARVSLKTQNQSTAIEKAKDLYYELMVQQRQGKTYFSLNCKAGVDMYLKQRQTDVDDKTIVKGRLGTIKTHLGHWLNFIGKDRKLKELERTDCENYYGTRTKTKKGIQVSQTTVENEQSTINAMMAWLHKRNETYIDGFDFKKLKKIDTGDQSKRRTVFSDDEIFAIGYVLDGYIKEGLKDIDEGGNLIKVITAYYLMISMLSGLRRGEQTQLRWKDVELFEEKKENVDYDLVKIRVRGVTSKTGKTREFVIKDHEYFENLRNLTINRYRKAHAIKWNPNELREMLVFSTDGKTPLSARAIGWHFNKTIADAEIENVQNRDIVPYCFRHTYITQKINSNLSPAAVAESCGTSITQISKTYYHTTKEKMISNALASYVYRNGMLVPV